MDLKVVNHRLGSQCIYKLVMTQEADANIPFRALIGTMRNFIFFPEIRDVTTLVVVR